MMCCSAPSRQQRRPARSPGATPTAASAEVTSKVSIAAGGPREHEHQILVEFPGQRGAFVEVCWSEDPSNPLTMDGIKELLRQADPAGDCAGSDFDILDDDGDALLAPSTWPPKTRVMLHLEGQLNATCQGTR